ncbi:hypothetical protein ACGFYF_42540 [Streptomyces lavendulae]|uniref:hypothetical protein n=1 Tax=Streptomyces lavendulae TaxID=1914 RepID=UPI00371F31C4
MNSIETQNIVHAAAESVPHADLRNLHHNLTRHLEKIEEDIRGTLDVAMELIQSVRFSADEVPPGTGECFAQIFLSLQKKMTARDTLLQGVNSLAALVKGTRIRHQSRLDQNS